MPTDDQTIRFRDRLMTVPAGRPLLMGIVNTNPDSFSDVRRLDTLDAQVDHAMTLVRAGADLIDVGGESGVTYTGVTAEEVEIERVCPLVQRLAAEGVIVSVDTWKAAVAEASLQAGAAMLNDVSGLRDPVFADLCARTGAALVVMHTRAAPKQEHFAQYDGDVAADVASFLAQRVALAREHGVPDNQIVLDPGPDFAKTPAETIASLHDLGTLRATGLPLLLAVSNKYFVGAITGRAPGERLAGTLAAVGWSADQGAAIVRVHDVAAAADYLKVRRVLQGAEPMPAFDPDDDALKWIRATS